jgi:hypothetical protein
MYPTKINRVRAMHAIGWSKRDIATTCNVTYAEIAAVLPQETETLEERQLRTARRELLARVPRWWKGRTEEYQRVVEANFPTDVA